MVLSVERWLRKCPIVEQIRVWGMSALELCAGDKCVTETIISHSDSEGLSVRLKVGKVTEKRVGQKRHGADWWVPAHFTTGAT